MTAPTPSPAGSPAPQDPLQPVLDDLELIDHTELSGQAEIYERLHTALATALAGTVDQPGPVSAGR
jgi:hypothetical protein